MSSDDPVGAADFRRALALIQHGERGDEAGMRVIVDDEVIPAGRLPQLIRATVSILWQLVAQLCEPDEVAEIGETLTLAAAPDQVDLERDNRLVARIATFGASRRIASASALPTPSAIRGSSVGRRRYTRRISGGYTADARRSLSGEGNPVSETTS